MREHTFFGQIPDTGSGTGIFVRRRIALDNARQEPTVIAANGHAVAAVAASSARAEIELRVQHDAGGSTRFRQGSYVELTAFSELFFTNTAQPGAWIELLIVSDHARVRSSPQIADVLWPPQCRVLIPGAKRYVAHTDETVGGVSNNYAALQVEVAPNKILRVIQVAPDIAQHKVTVESTTRNFAATDSPNVLLDDGISSTLTAGEMQAASLPTVTGWEVGVQNQFRFAFDGAYWFDVSAGNFFVCWYPQINQSQNVGIILMELDA